MQHKLYVVRETVMAVLIAFSIIVVAVNGHYIFITLNDTLFVDGFKAWPQDSPDVFSVYNVAVAGLTLLTLPVMLLIDRYRKKAFTSMIIVEVVWLGVLWVLWIAAASNTVRAVRILIALCNLRVNKKVGVLQAACRDVRASEAFGHLSWVVLFGYVSILFVLAFRSAQQGHPVWRKSVRKSEFTTNWNVNVAELAQGHDPNAKEQEAVGAQPQNLSYSYPPVVQQPVMQQYDPSQQGMPQIQQPLYDPAPQQLPGQVPTPQPQVPYGQVPYPQGPVPVGTPIQTPVPQGVPVQAPVAQYGQAQV